CACPTLLYYLSCPPRSSPFPYTTLFRSGRSRAGSFCRYAPGISDQPRANGTRGRRPESSRDRSGRAPREKGDGIPREDSGRRPRSEEHTSELQSHLNLVCRLLLEKTETD